MMSLRRTRTAPMGAVGGEWPELGYLPPTPPQSGTPPVDPLPAGEEVMLSDAILDEKVDELTKSQVLAEMLVMQRGSRVMLNLGKGNEMAEH